MTLAILLENEQCCDGLNEEVERCKEQYSNSTEGEKEMCKLTLEGLRE